MGPVSVGNCWPINSPSASYMSYVLLSSVLAQLAIKKSSRCFSRAKMLASSTLASLVYTDEFGLPSMSASSSLAYLPKFVTVPIEPIEFFSSIVKSADLFHYANVLVRVDIPPFVVILI